MGKASRKIWFGIAMFLSGLILLLSVAGIVGAWVIEGALANTVVDILGAVENVTGSLRQATQGIDQNMEKMQAISTKISTASAQLSQNVTDNGLVQLLLPDQQEQQLVDLSASVKDTFGNLHDMLAAGMDFYNSIDRLPFVSLPGPSQEQVDKFVGSISEIESAVDGLKKNVAMFRSGAGDQIGKVQTGADSLTAQVGQARDQLASLDARLDAAQESLIRLQRIAVKAFMLATFLVTLLLAWVIYSQVAVLRLYGQRWKSSGLGSRPEAQPDRNAGAEDETVIESGPLAKENQGNNGN
jgi:hypothetical protein